MRVWLTLSGICTALFAADLATIEGGQTASADRSFELTVHGWFGLSTFGFFKAVSSIGGGTVRTVAIALIALTLVLTRRWWMALFLVVAVGGSALLNTVVKDIVARPRPHLFSGALHESSYSFPSGHAMDNIAFFGALACLVWLLTRNERITAVVACLGLLFTLLVGLSRIVLGVHYPSDVFGGFMLGLAWLALCIAIGATARVQTAARHRAILGKRSL